MPERKHFFSGGVLLDLLSFTEKIEQRRLRILALFYCQIFPQYKGQFVMAMGTESPSSFSTQFMKTSYKCALL